MTRNRGLSGIAIIDLFCNSMLGFIALFILALIQIRPVAENQKSVPTGGEYVLVVTWEPKSEDDVDTYLRDPQGHIVFFNRREEGLMHLERDDLGTRNDMIRDKEGNTVQVEQNEERAVIRGIVPGEYIANVHMFRKVDQSPTKVKVVLVKLKGNKQLTEREVILERDGDEKTAFRFSLNAGGELEDINHLPYKIIGEKTNAQEGRDQ